MARPKMSDKRSNKGKCSIRLLVGGVLLSSISLLSYNILNFTPRQTEYTVQDREAKKRKKEACKRMRSLRDIRECFPPQLVRRLPVEHCQDVQDWETLQRCVTGRFYAEDDTGTEEPFTIHIIGERHSGTKFLMNELQQCFLQPSAASNVKKVHRDFLRSKHFFQPYRGENHLRSILVVIVRDPVEWVAAMHEMPYHSPNHVKSVVSEDPTKGVEPLPWQEFVSRPWTTQRSKLDEKLQSERKQHPERKIECQERFHFNDVVPCQVDDSYGIPSDRMRGMFPLYEMRRDGSGKPYDNILQMRADKITNFVLQLPMMFAIGGFVVVRYEDLMQKGSHFLLKQVAEVVGMKDGELPEECTPSKPQPERLNQRYIPSGLKKWVDEHLDVEREKLLGYR